MNRRTTIMFCLLSLCSVLLIFRVGGIGLSDDLQETAASQTRYTLRFGETRGKIYDCRMRQLVDEEETYLAACLPTPENMAGLLESDALAGADIAALLETGRPFLAKCSVSELSLPDVQVFPVEKRNSETQLARHIIGYLNDSGQGLTGIERAFDSLLSEKNESSAISYSVNGKRQPLSGVKPQVSLAPIRTDGVVLTIDSRIQRVVEEIGGRMLQKGAIVVMEPDTGKLRAVASFPGYTEDTLALAVKDEENSPMLNRAFSAYSVGSTFKIVTAAAALSAGISPQAEYECAGSIDVYGQEFGCHLKSGHGLLDLRRALMVSCNPYFIQVGGQLSASGFLAMARDLSFGKGTQLADGFWSGAGTLPDEAALSSPAATANLSFGQGSLTATPVQVARMMCAVVNGGSTPEASLVEGTTADGKLLEERLEVSAGIRAMKPETARRIQADLVDCVMTEENQQAKPRYVTAGGKTGTAQTGQRDVDGEELLNGWFAGFFPAKNPELVVVVLAEEAKSGNQDASPVFREIADALHAPILLPEENGGV